MKKFKFFLPLALLATIGFVFTACNDDNGTDNPVSITITPNAPIEFTYEGGDKTIVVTATRGTDAITWTATSGNDWITISEQNTTTNTFKVTVPAYSSEEARQGSISVSAGGKTESFTVAQTAYALEFRVSPTSESVEFFGGLVDFTVITNADSWQAGTPSESWARVTSTTDNTFTVAVNENTDSNDRSVTISVTAEGVEDAQTIRITQDGAPSDAFELLAGYWTVKGTPAIAANKGPAEFNVIADASTFTSGDPAFIMTGWSGTGMDEDGLPFFFGWNGSTLTNVIGNLGQTNQGNAICAAYAYLYEFNDDGQVVDYQLIMPETGEILATYNSSNRSFSWPTEYIYTDEDGVEHECDLFFIILVLDNNLQETGYLLGEGYYNPVFTKSSAPLTRSAGVKYEVSPYSKERANASKAIEMIVADLKK